MCKRDDENGALPNVSYDSQCNSRSQSCHHTVNISCIMHCPCTCVCVCACVRACVRVRARTRVCVCVFVHARVPVCLLCSPFCHHAIDCAIIFLKGRAAIRQQGEKGKKNQEEEQKLRAGNVLCKNYFKRKGI